MSTWRSLRILTGIVLVYFGLWHVTYTTTPEYATAKSYVDSSEEISRLAGEGAARYGLPTGWIFRHEGIAYFRFGVRGSREAVKVKVVVLRVGDRWRIVNATYTGESGSGELLSENRDALHASSNRVDAGYALLQRGHLRDALAELDRAVELDSLHAEARFWRAAVYKSMNRVDASTADLRRALELNPYHARARLALTALEEAPAPEDGVPAECDRGQDEGCAPEVDR